MGHSVCNDDTAQLAIIDNLNGLTRENSMCDDGHNFLCSVGLEGFSGFGKSTACVGHVVDEDSDLVLDVSDENHAGDFVGTGTLFVDESKVEVETVGDGGCAGWGVRLGDFVEGIGLTAWLLQRRGRR